MFVRSEVKKFEKNYIGLLAVFEAFEDRITSLVVRSDCILAIHSDPVNDVWNKF